MGDEEKVRGREVLGRGGKNKEKKKGVDE